MSGLSKYSRHIFQSITEFGHAVNNLGPRLSGDYSIDEGQFDNVFSLPVTIDIAANKGGHWPEGAEGLAKVQIDATMATIGLKRALKLGVIGAIPNIPAYLAGHPMNMIEISKDPKPKKYLRLGVHVGGLSTTTQAARLNRGKAIMAIVEALETEGYSIEIWGIWRNRGVGDTRHIAASIEVCLKQSSAVWNSHTAAFALANTSFQRRLCWRFIESSESHKLTPGYGRGDSAPHDDFDLYFPYVDDVIERALRTPAKALDYAVDIAKRALVK
jgi:hypothetical protein